MRVTPLDSAVSGTVYDTRSRGRGLVGILAALVVTGLVFTGYILLRKRHQQAIAPPQAQELGPTQSKEPAKAQILVDDALLKGDQTILGGTVKNISSENLNNLTVNLSLIHRKDGTSQMTTVQVEPTQLLPQQEGRYLLQLRSADYRSAKLVGLKGGANAAAVTYIAAPGQKRPPEILESKTIIVKRPSSSKGEFLNTPDRPSRVP